MDFDGEGLSAQVPFSSVDTCWHLGRAHVFSSKAWVYTPSPEESDKSGEEMDPCKAFGEDQEDEPKSSEAGVLMCGIGWKKPDETS